MLKSDGEGGGGEEEEKVDSVKFVLFYLLLNALSFVLGIHLGFIFSNTCGVSISIIFVANVPRLAVVVFLVPSPYIISIKAFIVFRANHSKEGR